MSTGAAVGAAVKRAERRLVGPLRDSGAVSPATACSVPDQRWMGKRVLGRLIRVGVIHEVKTGYYLDEEVYSTYRARRKPIVVAVIGIIVAVAALVSWWASQR